MQEAVSKMLCSVHRRQIAKNKGSDDAEGHDARVIYM